MNLILGTAQFGLNYGVTNEEGKVSAIEVNNILEYAKGNGINMIDTAAAYGDSEEVLGKLCKSKKSLKFITKVPSLKSESANIIKTVESSRRKLCCSNLYAVLFHDEKDIVSSTSERNVDRLLELKSNGVIQKIGSSFYTHEALEKALIKHKLDIIQIPANALDQRFLNSGVLDEAKKQGIEVHVRSLFLQGLLLDPNASLPINIRNDKHLLDNFFKLASDLSLSPIELALIYFTQNELFDFGVFGCLNLQQLVQISDCYYRAKTYINQIDFTSLSSSSGKLINPTLW